METKEKIQDWLFENSNDYLDQDGQLNISDITQKCLDEHEELENCTENLIWIYGIVEDIERELTE